MKTMKSILPDLHASARGLLTKSKRGADMTLTVEKIKELQPRLHELELDIRHLEINHIICMDRRLCDLWRCAEGAVPGNEWAQRRLNRRVWEKLSNPNLVWNSRGEESVGFKRLLANLVGWYSEHPEPAMRTPAAWHIMFGYLYPLLYDRVVQLRENYTTENGWSGPDAPHG